MDQPISRREAKSIDGRQAQPSLVGADVGHVATPDRAEQHGLEHSADQIRDRWSLLVGLGERPPWARRVPLEALLAHQPGGLLAVDHPALVASSAVMRGSP